MVFCPKILRDDGDLQVERRRKSTVIKIVHSVLVQHVKTSSPHRLAPYLASRWHFHYSIFNVKQNLLPRQHCIVKILGFPCRVSTSLRSPTKSSVSQALLLFLSSRWPCLLPWQIIVNRKVLLSSWVLLSMIHLFNFLISWKIRIMPLNITHMK